jgi:hypothetical protein
MEGVMTRLVDAYLKKTGCTWLQLNSNFYERFHREQGFPHQSWGAFSYKGCRISDGDYNNYDFEDFILDYIKQNTP